MSGTTLRSEARTRDVYDRVRGYTYSFHPAGVVHLNPLGLQRWPSPSRDTSHNHDSLTMTVPSCFPGVGYIRRNECPRVVNV